MTRSRTRTARQLFGYGFTSGALLMGSIITIVQSLKGSGGWVDSSGLIVASAAGVAGLALMMAGIIVTNDFLARHLDITITHWTRP